jgi:hypothetical protein
MFLKKMSCLVLAFSCVSIAPSSLPRTASSCNFDDAEAIDSSGQVISLQSLSTEAQVVAAKAILSAASAQPSFTVATPTNRTIQARVALQPLTIPPHDAQQKTTPTTPHNSFADVSAHSEPPLSTRSQQSLAISAQTPAAPQQIPVEAIPPITPIATPRPNSPPNMLAPLAAHALLGSGFLVAPPAHSIAKSSPALGQTLHAHPKPISEAALAQRMAAHAQNARLHTACTNAAVSKQNLQAAQHPMHLPQSQPADIPVQQSLDVRITIVPENKAIAQKEDQPEYCCFPITCCGNTASCPKMSCTIL